MNILIFEDSSFSDLFPLSILRPVYDIKTGILTNLERLEKIVPGKYKISLHCRNILSSYISSIQKRNVNTIEREDYLLINGRIFIDENILKLFLKKLPDNSAFVSGNCIIAAKISKQKLSFIKHKIENKNLDNTLNLKDFDNLKLNEFKNEIPIYNYVWDVIKNFDNVLNYDLDLIWDEKKKIKIPHTVSVINPDNIKISKSSKIATNVVLDAENGKIILDDNVTIEPFCFLKGPVFIGKNVLLKSGAKIYGHTMIGQGSKITGEISGSIFHSNVNKQHDGFIGNSYACPFVNFGADTVTSNLKNNYSKVKVKFNSEMINTGMQFLGTIAGDHTKFGINTMLNTGTIAGIFANIAGGGFPEKQIESFSWNILGREPVRYKIDEALETAKSVMSRRHIDMTPELENLIRENYKMV